jgi:hypothetical protein
MDGKNRRLAKLSLQGDWDCSRAGGDGLGASRPDSSSVVRTGPIAPAPEARVRVGRGISDSSARPFFRGLGVGELTGGSLTAAVSEMVSLVLLRRDTLRSLVFPSAASAPAIRICSSVGSLESVFLGRDRRLVSAGVGDLVCSVCSGGGGAGLSAIGLVSRARITSCARISPTMKKTHSNTLGSPSRIKRQLNKYNSLASFSWKNC